MGIYIEALILYILLFFSGAAAIFTNTGATEFSIAAELIKILMYYIPSLGLIWYLIYRAKELEIAVAGEVLNLKTSFYRIEQLKFKLGKNDLISALIALPCLLITGFIITWISSVIGNTGQVTLYSPTSITQWIILCLSCIISAYLEESYFRFYLLSKRKEMNLNIPGILILSVLLFSVCHIYGGLWSFINAAICGTFLCLVFLKYNSIHGIAIAHGLYNISAFVLYAATN